MINTNKQTGPGSPKLVHPLVNGTPRKPPSWTSPIALILTVCTGFMFGFAMNKGNVHSPFVIQSQMKLTQFIMMKMFLGALGASLLSASSFRFFRPKSFEYIQSKRATDPSHAAVLIVGGLLVGIGMTVSGSCPGSVYVQLGASGMSLTAVYVFLGALLGTFIVGILKPFISKWQELRPKVNMTLPLSTAFHCLFGVFMLGISILLEYYVDEATDPVSWYPTVAGVVVGLLQLPLIAVLSKSLGATASYKIVLSEPIKLFRKVSGLKLAWLYLPAIGDKSTLLFALSAIVGSSCADRPTYTGPLPSPLSAVVGGTLLGLGANIACGCTSGHGLSGVAMLMVSSTLVLPSIFAGAISTGLIARALELL